MDLKKVTHVLFDLDGTLMDSEKILNKIITDIVESYGKKYTPEARTKVVGTPEKESARIVVKETGLPITGEEFLQIYNEKMAKELQNVPLFPGAEELIKHFYRHGVPIALATSSSKFTFNIKAKHYQKLFSLFNHQVLGGSDPEVKYGKPAPDIFLVCASRFEDNPKPQQCLVFEDAPNGVKAAKSAGMQVVMIPSSDFPEEVVNQATLVLNSLQDFRPELFGLPQFEIC